MFVDFVIGHQEGFCYRLLRFDHRFLATLRSTLICYFSNLLQFTLHYYVDESDCDAKPKMPQSCCWYHNYSFLDSFLYILQMYQIAFTSCSF